MIYNNILDTIGNTPVVKYTDKIYLKLEFFNPSSSVKDRAAYSMIKNALDRGDINKDSILIEPTSGNTGIGLAMVCAVLGLKLIICMPESMSIERRKNIAAYGAELVLTPAKDGMKGAVDRAIELKESYENAWIPMQFANPDNPKAHKQTAKEILDDTNADVVIAGIGTGGTAFGLREYLPKEILVYGVEPAESPLFTQGKAGPHKIQGIGANFIPDICKDKNLDGYLTVEGEKAIAKAKELAQKHGIFCGISAGANVVAAEELSATNPEKVIVAIIPDSGERYLSVW